MPKTTHLTINGQTVKANIGETLVDAGLGGWMVIPHDCCSGQCETCRVTVVKGAVDDQGTADGRTVLACQATVIGDAEIEFDDVPVTTRQSGILAEITRLAPDVLEISVELDMPFEYRPGQYFSVKFSGFPARDLSATLRADGWADRRELIFQIRRYPGGLVSTQIGATIRVGHRVSIRGPYGQAFLRENTGPLVLVAGGTGWAPIWSIAGAARNEQPNRDLFVIAGAIDPSGLYMRRSLDRLIDEGVNVIATTEVGNVDPVLSGRPTLYLPSLGPEDTVHVAGPSGLVDAVRRKAREARARCYADPFLPSLLKPSLVDRIMRMLHGSGQASVDRPSGRSISAGHEAEREPRPGEAGGAAPRIPGQTRGGALRRERQKTFRG